jgi:hypothetical protein
MNKIHLLVILLAFTFNSCERSDSENKTPGCLENQIIEFKATACESGAAVKEYHFQDKTVYVFDPGSCGADMTSAVVDNQCNVLGALGGITGNTKIEGKDFSTATYIRTIWTN